MGYCVEMNIVLTREAGKNDEARSWFPSDATVEEVPLTTTNYFSIDDVTKQLQATPDFGLYAVLVVSSRRTADYVHAALGAVAQGADLLTVGTATTHSLRDRGIEVSAEATDSAIELDGVITKGPVLFVGAKQMREELSDELQRRKIAVTKVACYETLPVELSVQQIGTLSNADVILIGAPTAWSVARDFVKRNAWVVVPGATTKSIVAQNHARVIEGWGPSLADIVPNLQS
jgi:uroporphyrinogen-III synthase